jgi:mRNA interferase MazF
MNPRPGEVWLADLGWEGKVRPVVIVSRDDPDPPRSLVVYAPLTTQNRKSAYEVPLPKLRFLKEASVVNVQGIGSLPTVRLGRQLGVLPDSSFESVKTAIAWALSIEDRDLEKVVEWLYGTAREAGHTELIRDLIRKAHTTYVDGYRAPGDENEIDDRVTDELGVSRAFARFSAKWDEEERDWNESDATSNE